MAALSLSNALQNSSVLSFSFLLVLLSICGDIVMALFPPFLPLEEEEEEDFLELEAVTASPPPPPSRMKSSSSSSKS